MTPCKVWNYCGVPIKYGTTVAHDNTVLKHFVAKIVFLGGSDRQGKKILE